ncbi:MAG: hypothetical protein ABR577_15310 [Pyrinomonadaceae bacterium]
MIDPSSAKDAAMHLPESSYPRCLHCNKRVAALTVSPHPNHAGKVIIEYQCHGESVSQEMASSVLASEQGLASYTAFNAYTSGLMPVHSSEHTDADARKHGTLESQTKTTRKLPEDFKRAVDEKLESETREDKQ